MNSFLWNWWIINEFQKRHCQPGPFKETGLEVLVMGRIKFGDIIQTFSRKIWSNGNHMVYSTISSSSNIYSDNNNQWFFDFVDEGRGGLKLTKGKDGEDSISCSNIQHSVSSEFLLISFHRMLYNWTAWAQLEYRSPSCFESWFDWIPLLHPEFHWVVFVIVVALLQRSSSELVCLF